MANVNDYLLWRGDLPFCKEYGFNEIDSLILARFSYLVFNKIKMKEEETIESISKKMRKLSNDEFLFNGDRDLIINLGNSIRYKDLIVTDYINNFDKSLEQQFGAITVHLFDNELYVSYIGTDSSINGWKEDFNMMFLEDVPCQILGKEYLENIANKYPQNNIRIGGHSKGGNVAIYSAISVNEKIQKRIIEVNNYDGPGFKKEVLKRANVKLIMPKIRTYIPQDSVVGRLLYHKEETSIVLSIEKGIMQHDIYSWQVLKDKLVYCEKSTNNSEIIDETITKWFEETTNEQRKIVVNTIFDLLYSTNNESFNEIGNDWSKSIPIIMKSYSNVSKEDKKMISLVIKKILKIYLKIVKDQEKQKILQQLIKFQMREVLRNN